MAAAKHPDVHGTLHASGQYHAQKLDAKLRKWVYIEDEYNWATPDLELDLLTESDLWYYAAASSESNPGVMHRIYDSLEKSTVAFIMNGEQFFPAAGSVEAERHTRQVAGDWADAEALLKAGVRRLLLFGPPGTGKTFAARHFGLAPKQRVYNIYVSEESPSYDVIGHDVVRDGDIVWRDGPAILSWRHSGRLVVNELDKASGDTLDALLAICDDPESAGYVLPTGEYVEPGAGFSVVATMNGDPDDLPEALRDRFVVRMKIENPHPKAIEALPKDLRELARSTTNAGVAQDRRFSIRQFRAFAELTEKGIAEEVAARSVFAHRANDMLAALAVKKVRRS